MRIALALLCLVAACGGQPAGGPLPKKPKPADPPVIAKMRNEYDIVRVSVDSVTGIACYKQKHRDGIACAYSPHILPPTGATP